VLVLDDSAKPAAPPPHAGRGIECAQTISAHPDEDEHEHEHERLPAIPLSTFPFCLLPSRPPRMIALTIENVTKRFGETVALDRIDLRIGAGEIFFLLGPSGCGKTTLLRAIAGFNLPDAGRILFGDEDVTRLPPHLRHTGMMFQSYALWPHLTVARNVAFGLEERKVPALEIARRVAEALEQVKMSAYGERKIHQLSGGQQQRVALARALVIRPRCLLLDEPLSNLDTRLRIEMRGEIRRICQEFGLTAIYVTHDQKEALSVADRMAIMESGHLRQTGTPAEVYRHPCSRFVAEFMGETNFLSGKVSAVNGAAVRIETGMRSFDAALRREAWQPRVGEACTLSIRPESWRLSTENGAPNSVAGRIHDRVYLGEMAQYRFTAGAEPLKIFELNPKFVELSPEREVFASVAPEDLVVLPG
jgi:iron(III) transport system ATP-binding protein